MAARSWGGEIACPEMCSAVMDEGLRAPEMIHCCVYAHVNQMPSDRLKKEPKGDLFVCRACDM